MRECTKSRRTKLCQKRPKWGQAEKKLRDLAKTKQGLFAVANGL